MNFVRARRAAIAARRSTLSAGSDASDATSSTRFFLALISSCKGGHDKASTSSADQLMGVGGSAGSVATCVMDSVTRISDGRVELAARGLMKTPSPRPRHVQGHSQHRATDVVAELLLVLEFVKILRAGRVVRFIFIRIA